MEPDPTILARQATATALVWPEPTLIAQPAGAGVTAQAAHGTPHESHPPAAAAALPEPAEPPDLDCLGDRIAELSSRIDAATYELLCYLHQFNQQYGWEGFRSCAHWLNWRTGLDLGAAREKLRVAAALAELPHIAAAMACGRLSYSKVRALSRVAAPATEARLLALACGATAAQVERLVRGWRQADQAAQADGEQVRLASRMLSTQVDDNGMLLLRARLTPEVGAVLLRAVEAALEQVPPPAAPAAEGNEPTIAQRRADALGLVAESALAGGLDPGNPGDRFQVTVHVPADTLASREPASTTPRVSAEPRAASPAASQPVAAAAHAGRETAAGRASEAASTPPHVSAEPSEASAGAGEPAPPAADLDAGQAVIEQAGGLHLGGRRRAALPAMPPSWRCSTAPTARSSTSAAGRARSRPPCAALCWTVIAASASSPAATPATATPTTSCTGPTAGRPSSPTWLCCRFHHRALHEEGFQVVADAAGQFRFLRPDGVPLPAEPPAACWEGAPLAPTDARLASAGVSIGPYTATPDWYGESLDLTAALDVLWQPPARVPQAAVARGAP